VYEIINGFQEVNDKVSDIDEKTRLDRMTMLTIKSQITDKNTEIQALKFKLLQ